VYIVDDMLEHLGDAAVNYVAVFTPVLLSCVGDADAAVRRGAAYGVSVCAGKHAAAFAAGGFVAAAAAALQPALQTPAAAGDDEMEWGAAADNVVSALCSLAQHHNMADALLPSILNALPLREDTDDEVVYAYLCAFAEASLPQLVAANATPPVLGQQCIIATLLRIFTAAYCSEFASVAVSGRIHALVRAMHAAAPQVFQTAAAALDEEGRDKVEAIFFAGPPPGDEE
jgi:hypothetical protein